MYYKDIKIPKKGTGHRKVSVPSKELLSTQRKALKELVKIVVKLLAENNLSSCVHGFIPKKNACTAAKLHVGYDCTVILDICDFFDNCTKSMVIQQIPEIQSRSYFVSLFHDDGYCAQGFATSPVLSTVCLTPVLTKLKEDLAPILKEFVLTVYADDIQISFNKDKTEAESYYKENSAIQIVKTVASSFGFKIKDSKTRVRYAKYGYRRILGINVGDMHLAPSRKTNKKIRAARHQNNHQSLGGLTTWAKCLEPKLNIYKKNYITGLKDIWTNC